MSAITPKEMSREESSAPATNHLADLWRKELIQEMKARRNRVKRAAEACTSGGWYRGQLEQQVALYDCMLAAVAPSAPAQEGDKA